jgi:hypothetical protein
MYLPVPNDYDGDFETIVVEVLIRRNQLSRKSHSYDETRFISDSSDRIIYWDCDDSREHFECTSNVKKENVQILIDDLDNHNFKPFYFDEEENSDCDFETDCETTEHKYRIRLCVIDK